MVTAVHQRLLIVWLLQAAIATGGLGPHCPNSFLELQEYRSVTPFGNKSAGFYENAGLLPKDECIYACCESESCNIVFIHRGNCFLIKCRSDPLCEPLPREGKKFENTFMLKIRPVDSADEYDENFFDLPSTSSDQIYYDKSSVMRRGEKSEPVAKITVCASTKDCGTNEICVKKNYRTRQGVCKCSGIYIRDKVTNLCIDPDTSSVLFTTISSFVEQPNSVRSENENYNESSGNLITNLTKNPPVTTIASMRHLVVSAGEDKVLQLPENAISLSAFAVPKESEGEHYKYEWTLVSQPAGDETGVMSDTNLPTVKLSQLREGLYTFRVTVSSNVSFGEDLVNVTVLAPKRVNQPPVAIINPVNQTVKLPNTDTVLDASASTDDDKIVSYIWEIVSAPMGYAPQLSETATLQLKNLIPGFYRFMLTVTDSDGVKNSTYANVTVIKETDYRPVANAGADVIIYLPQNEVTLNGNLSTDDKGIKSWEWTKGDGVDKAVDMQNTRTPLLHLSNLEVGMYTFILRVTDTADQTSTAEVHVFVKQGNEGPVADAGGNQEIMLPVNFVTLYGNKSHDDIGITQWEWKQVSGPSPAKIENADQVQAFASELTKGVYVFQLTVYDDKKASNSATVTVTVKQSKNDPPKANAGGDRTVELPCNLVMLNGSVSSDDVGIVSYEWTRDLSSLAAGEILRGTDKTSLLMLANLISGRYLFKLTVTDASGLKNSDTASLIVKPAPHDKDDVEMYIGSDIYSFTEEQKVTISRKLGLLLQDSIETTVVMSSVTMEKNTNRVILVFHVEKLLPNGQIVIQHGPTVVQVLKKRLKMDGALLDVPVISVDTVICQNNCSNHGTCDQFTKRCVCEAFWMENFFKFYFGDGESNCDWSILYVCIVLFIVLLFFGSLSWGLVCVCSWKQRKPRMPSRIGISRQRRKHKYTLLDNITSDKEALLVTKGKHQHNSVMVSDSDLESDTIFEQNEKSSMQISNGFSKFSDARSTSPQKVRT